MKRLQLEKDAKEGKGFGPAPKTVAKPYVSAYAKNGSVSGISAYYIYSSGHGHCNTLFRALHYCNFNPFLPAPGGKQYYCEVCEKQLNGPKPYQAHMNSKAHKEEVALLEN